MAFEAVFFGKPVEQYAAHHQDNKARNHLDSSIDISIPVGESLVGTHIAGRLIDGDKDDSKQENRAEKKEDTLLFGQKIGYIRVVFYHKS